jgi:hypothetical protein
MRLSADSVLAAIDHADGFAHEAALEYFTESFSTNPRVMPAVIRAAERYAGRASQLSLYKTEKLVQSDESVRWLLGQLRESKPRPDDRGRWDAASPLLAAPPELLKAHADEIAASPGLSADEKAAAGERVELATLPPEELWKRLEEFCRSKLDACREYPSKSQLGTADRLALALGPHPEFVTEPVLAVLRGETGDRGHWLETYALRIARHARLTTAIPNLIGNVIADAGDWLNDESQWALAAIGSDESLRRIEGAWERLSTQARFAATFVLQELHTDACAAAILVRAPREEDRGVRCRLYEAALRNFEPDAVEPARELVLRSGADQLTRGVQNMDARELRFTLVATAPIMGVTFPEYERWHKEELDIRDNLEHQMKELTSEGGTPLMDDMPSRFVPIENEGAKVGRNDPCPCGSGKKFKKCCGARK